MNSFEMNKVLGALLGTCLVLVAMHIASGAIFEQAAPAKPGYDIAVTGAAAAGRGSPGGVHGSPIASLLPTASADRGAQVAKQCQACHNFQEGQGAKVGPNLYGVVGRAHRLGAGLQLLGRAKGHGGYWTFDALNTWLLKPSADAPGTAMTFAGISNEKQRADIIAYLDTLSPNPVPLPKAADAGAPAAPAAPAADAPAKQ